MQYTLDYISFWVVGIIMMYFFFDLVAYQRDLETKYAEIETLSAQTQTTSITTQINEKYSELDDMGDNWLLSLQINLVLSCLWLTSLMQSILIFVSYLARGISVLTLSRNFTFLAILDFIQAIFIVTFVASYLFGDIYNDTYSQYRDEERRYRMMRAANDDTLDIISVISIIFACVFYKYIFLLIYEKFFGKFVQIVIQMAKDTIKFVVIFAICLVAFAIFGYCNFYDLEEYETFMDSLLTLYGSSLGGFDFAVFDSAQFTAVWAGKLFMIIYLLLFTILLLNFLIAILSDTYALLMEKGRGLQMAEIIRLRPIYEYHPHYYCLVKSTVFFSFIPFVMMPIILIAKSKKLNNALLKIEYTINSLFIYFINEIIVLSGYPLLLFTIVMYKFSVLQEKSKNV